MRKIYLIAGLWAAVFYAKAQQVVTFEDFTLEQDSYYKGADGAGGFFSGEIWFPVDYNAEWGSWSGFSVSNMKDTETAGYDNQFSAITGKGADNSGQYSVVYIPGELMLEFDYVVTVKGFEVTNSTLTYLMMRDGDSNGFSKKFGGNDGNDPDYLKLMVWGRGVDDEITDTLEFFLADYRFENNDTDYLVKEWEWFDLSSLGVVKQIYFGMESSDTGEWGMNTPAYFCMDNFKLEKEVTASENISKNSFNSSVYPNPFKEHIFVNLPDGSKSVVIADLSGKVLFRKEVSGDKKIKIDALNELNPGIYILKTDTENGMEISKILKTN